MVESVTIDSVATYTCDRAYALVGQPTRTCVRNGADTMWSGQAPTCQCKHNMDPYLCTLHWANIEVSYYRITRGYLKDCLSVHIISFLQDTLPIIDPILYRIEPNFGCKKCMQQYHQSYTHHAVQDIMSIHHLFYTHNRPILIKETN